MKDKVCMVTGASSGIGKAVTTGLAKTGAKIVMVSQNVNRANKAREEIVATTGNKNVEVILADFASQKSIIEMTEHFYNKHDRLDVLVNNAGAHFSKHHETVEGVEMTFAINYLSHFLLTNLLSDILIKSAPCRIVNVAGEYHRKGEIHFDDLHLEKHYTAFKATSQAQLARVLFTYELARRAKELNIIVNCAHPGAVATHIIDHDPDISPFLKFLFKLARPMMDPPAKGAETILYLTTSPEIEATGKYFIKKQAVRSSEKSYDEKLALRLWDVSKQLTTHGDIQKSFEPLHYDSNKMYSE